MGADGGISIHITIRFITNKFPKYGILHYLHVIIGPTVDLDSSFYQAYAMTIISIPVNMSGI